MKIKAVVVKDNKTVFTYRMKEVQKVMASMRMAKVPEVEVQAAVRAYWANVSTQRA